MNLTVVPQSSQRGSSGGWDGIGQPGRAGRWEGQSRAWERPRSGAARDPRLVLEEKGSQKRLRESRGGMVGGEGPVPGRAGQGLR